MINSSTAITKYKIQENVAEYPIGFGYSFNADGTPQIAVRINGGDATYGEHWVLSLDRTAVIILAEEQIGAQLTIRRAIPLVQESDYQVGRIDPEQVEADFDASVERDQMLDEHIEALRERVRRNEEELDEIWQEVEDLQEKQAELARRVGEDEARITQNELDIAGFVEEQARQDAAIEKAQSRADEAFDRPVLEITLKD